MILWALITAGIMLGYGGVQTAAYWHVQEHYAHCLAAQQDLQDQHRQGPVRPCQP